MHILHMMAPYLSDLVRLVDRVPHAQRAAVLCHHHIRVRHPLHIVAEGQQRGASGGLQIVAVRVQDGVDEFEWQSESERR